MRKTIKEDTTMKEDTMTSPKRRQTKESDEDQVKPEELDVNEAEARGGCHTVGRAGERTNERTIE
jgi:hypothetical protein